MTETNINGIYVCLLAFLFGVFGVAAFTSGCVQPKPPTTQQTIVLAGYEASLDQCVAAAAKLEVEKYAAYQSCADDVDRKFGLKPQGGSR